MRCLHRLLFLCKEEREINLEGKELFCKQKNFLEPFGFLVPREREKEERERERGERSSRFINEKLKESKSSSKFLYKNFLNCRH